MQKGNEIQTVNGANQVGMVVNGIGALQGALKKWKTINAPAYAEAKTLVRATNAISGNPLPCIVLDVKKKGVAKDPKKECYSRRVDVLIGSKAYLTKQDNYEYTPDGFIKLPRKLGKAEKQAEAANVAAEAAKGQQQNAQVPKASNGPVGNQKALPPPPQQQQQQQTKPNVPLNVQNKPNVSMKVETNKSQPAQLQQNQNQQRAAPQKQTITDALGNEIPIDELGDIGDEEEHNQSDEGSDVVHKDDIPVFIREGSILEVQVPESSLGKIARGTIANLYNLTVSYYNWTPAVKEGEPPQPTVRRHSINALIQPIEIIDPNELYGTFKSLYATSSRFSFDEVRTNGINPDWSVLSILNKKATNGWPINFEKEWLERAQQFKDANPLYRALSELFEPTIKNLDWKDGKGRPEYRHVAKGKTKAIVFTDDDEVKARMLSTMNGVYVYDVDYDMDPKKNAFYTDPAGKGGSNPCLRFGVSCIQWVNDIKNMCFESILINVNAWSEVIQIFKIRDLAVHWVNIGPFLVKNMNAIFLGTIEDSSATKQSNLQPNKMFSFTPEIKVQSIFADMPRFVRSYGIPVTKDFAISMYQQYLNPDMNKYPYDGSSVVLMNESSVSPKDLLNSAPDMEFYVIAPFTYANMKAFSEAVKSLTPEQGVDLLDMEKSMFDEKYGSSNQKITNLSIPEDAKRFLYAVSKSSGKSTPKNIEEAIKEFLGMKEQSKEGASKSPVKPAANPNPAVPMIESKQPETSAASVTPSKQSEITEEHSQEQESNSQTEHMDTHTTSTPTDNKQKRKTTAPSQPIGTKKPAAPATGAHPTTKKPVASTGTIKKPKVVEEEIDT